MYVVSGFSRTTWCHIRFENRCVRSILASRFPKDPSARHMKFCRFGDHRLGVVEGNQVRDVTAALEVLPTYRYPLPGHDVLIAGLDAVAARARAIVMQSPSLPLDGLRFLSPIANPGKLVAAPVNYNKHLDEVRGDAALHHNNTGHTLTIH